MFEREHHLRIAAILQELNTELLLTNGCLFGGGTAIVLSHHEYRESVDIDFLVSSQQGYRALRQRLLTPEGIRAIARPGSILTAARGVRADQYGLRTMLVMAGVEIKFEILFESRIELAPPEPSDRICGVASLTCLDMASTKLLANSDRWADDSVFSRDLIDLAMLDAPRSMIGKAIAKAAAAYGDSIERDLGKAISQLARRRGRLDECMTALGINRVPIALLWKRIRGLKPRLARVKP